MNEKHFGMLKNLFKRCRTVLVKTDSENLYIANRVIVFKFPIEYKKEILSAFETEYDKLDDELKAFALEEYDEECDNDIIETRISQKSLEENCKIFKDIENLFQDTDFVPATATLVAGMISDIITLAPMFSEIILTSIIDTEDGLLQVNSEHIKLAVKVLQQFLKPEEIKKFVNRKNKYLYLKNDAVEAVLLPMQTSIEEQKAMFKKEFLI